MITARASGLTRQKFNKEILKMTEPWKARLALHLFLADWETTHMNRVSQRERAQWKAKA